MSQLSVLIANVQSLLAETTQDYFDANSIRRGIAEAYKYYFLYIAKHGEGYFEATDNLGFTSGVETVSLTGLSNTFHRIRLLERRVINGTIPLTRKARYEQASYTTAAPAGDAYRPSYDLMGQNLLLDPIPQFTEAGSATTGLKIRYVYLPTFPDYSSADSFTFNADFPTVHEPCVELRAAIYCMNQKKILAGEDDVGGILKRLNDHEEMLRLTITRDEAPNNIEYVGEDYSTY